MCLFGRTPHGQAACIIHAARLSATAEGLNLHTIAPNVGRWIAFLAGARAAGWVCAVRFIKILDFR
jgi:hypothetical protein